MIRKTVGVRAFIISLGLGLASLLAWSIHLYIAEMRMSAQRRNCILIIDTLANAEKIYFDEFLEYTANLQKLGFRHGLPNMQIFLSIEAVPDEYREIVPRQFFPFVQKDSYQILATIRVDGTDSFCVVGSDTEAKMIESATSR